MVQRLLIVTADAQTRHSAKREKEENKKNKAYTLLFMYPPKRNLQLATFLITLNSNDANYKQPFMICPFI